jgi:thiol-disulfide isomerase/thioredoxin
LAISIDFPHFFFFSLTWKLQKIFSFCSKRDSLLFALFDKKSKKVKNRKKFGLPHPSVSPRVFIIILFLFLCVRDFKHQTPPKKRRERKGARAYYCNNTRTPKMSLIASSHRAFVHTLSAKHNIVAKGKGKGGRIRREHHSFFLSKESKRRRLKAARDDNTTRATSASSSNDFTTTHNHHQRQEPLSMKATSGKKKYPVATHSIQTIQTTASAFTQQEQKQDKKMIKKTTTRLKKSIVTNTNKQKWWEKYQSTSSHPRNLILVKNIDEFLSYLYASATMIHRDIDNHSNSIDEGVEDEEKSNDIEQILERKSPLVVVKYFREDCPACRSVHPKFAKIAEREFSNVLFLKVNLSEFDDSFAEDMNIVSVPHVQVYNGAEGLVSEFSLNLMPKSLRNFRNILDAYTSCADNLPKREIQGPASFVSATGWPGYYRGQMKYLVECKRNFWRFRRAEEDEEE